MQGMSRVWLGGVVAVAAPGVAAEDAAEGFACAAEGAVFGDGVDGVLTAGGGEAALAAEESAEGGAVENDEMDQEPPHNYFAVFAQ